jgi:uncharacterized protein YnzC (UPF0291/DUF896 family)
MPDPQSLQAFLADAEAASRELAALDAALQTRVNEIRRLAFKESRDLTVAEKDERSQLRAAQAEVAEALILLSADTLRGIDMSAELANLKSQIARVNGGLKDDLRRLEAIERYAAIAAKVTAALAKVANAALKLA